MKNHYQTLGVSPSASPEEIRSAYLKLSKRVHPDVNWGDRVFEEMFKDINEAYQVLGDATTRAAYNQRYNHFLNSRSQRSYRCAIIHFAAK
jgi:curved DNA-binding protein CbpA